MFVSVIGNLSSSIQILTVTQSALKLDSGTGLFPSNSVSSFLIFITTFALPAGIFGASD